MTNRKNITSASTLIALLSLVALLIFYTFKEYSSRTEEFRKDADRALKEALYRSEKEKVTRINSYWRKDVFDTSLVKFKAVKGRSRELQIQLYIPKSIAKDL